MGGQMLDLPDDRRKIRVDSRLVQRVDDVYVRSATGVRDLLCDDLDALRGLTGKENLRALPANSCPPATPVEPSTPNTVATLFSSGEDELAVGGQVPLLLAISDNGPQMRSVTTREFTVGVAIAPQFGCPHTPQDQAWIETCSGTS